jgi:hypothetical protein
MPVTRSACRLPSVSTSSPDLHQLVRARKVDELRLEGEDEGDQVVLKAGVRHVTNFFLMLEFALT